MKKASILKSSENIKFSASLLFTYFGIMLLMSGIHYGIVTLIQTNSWHDFWNVNIPLIYWFLVALALTIFTRKKIRRAYEKPMLNLADATRAVAGGDFSIYVPPLHSPDRLDYLDYMILDFNKMVEELGSVETLKTEFFSNVSHEIKTPISIIQNNAELLKSEDLNEACKEYADTIFLAAKRLNGLIEKMLKLNKLENGTIEGKPAPFDICAQLADSLLATLSAFENKEIEISAELEDKRIVTSDEALLGLVWDNLLSNAIKFTNGNGHVHVHEWAAEGFIYVSVKDDGIGMSSETQKHIFEKFYQGDTSHSTIGNGLGLALVKRVLQILGGEIEVKSEEGEGCEVIVKLKVEG